MHHPLAASILVYIAVGIAFLFAIGLAIVMNALERLHFSSTLAALSSALIVVAVWVDDPTWQSRLKATLTAIILFVMNSILSHSTARAIRIREEKHFEPKPEDHIPLITKENPTGLKQ